MKNREKQANLFSRIMAIRPKVSPSGTTKENKLGSSGVGALKMINENAVSVGKLSGNARFNRKI